MSLSYELIYKLTHSIYFDHRKMKQSGKSSSKSIGGESQVELCVISSGMKLTNMTPKRYLLKCVWNMPGDIENSA